MINHIQDYTDRLKLNHHPEVEKLKKLSQEIDSSKDPSEFQKLLNDQIHESLKGKVSSSQVQSKPDIQSEIKADPYRKKLFNASVEFESVFVKLMLSQMKKSVEKSGLLHGGHAEEIFEDMLYDEYAREMSKNSSLGLAEQIYASLSQNLPPIPKEKI